MKKVTILFITTIVISLLLLSCDEKNQTEPEDTEPPTVAITYPANNSEFVQGTVVNITAEATDNEEVDKVEFYVDGSKVSTDNYEPYKYEWDTADILETHTVYAKAYDTNENVTTSDVLTINISEPIQNVLMGYVTNSLGDPIENVLVVVDAGKAMKTNPSKSNYPNSKDKLARTKGSNKNILGRIKKDENFPFNLEDGERNWYPPQNFKGNNNTDFREEPETFAPERAKKNRDEIYTDGDGYYEITDLEEGAYSLTFQIENYEELSDNVNQTEGTVQHNVTLDAALLPQISGLGLDDGNYSIEVDWNDLSLPTFLGYNVYEQHFLWYSMGWTEDEYYIYPSYTNWDQVNTDIVSVSNYDFSSEEYNARYGSYVLPINFENEETGHTSSTPEYYLSVEGYNEAIVSFELTSIIGPYYIPDNTHEIAIHLRYLYDRLGNDVVAFFFNYGGWEVQISTDSNNWTTIGTMYETPTVATWYGHAKTFCLNEYKGETVYFRTDPDSRDRLSRELLIQNLVMDYSQDGSGFDYNTAPNPPSNPHPPHNSTDISLDTTLVWSCSDPDEDTLTYDVYFGIESDPPLLNSGQSDSTYDPGTLNEETTYYWQIIAHDDHSNSTNGDVWEFTTVENLPPEPPSNPNPTNNETSVSTDTNLSWTCTDPDGDPLTYDIYFGTSSNPSLVNSGQSGTTYDPGTLNEETTYYWQIIAHDDHSNSTTGDVWEFITVENLPPEPPSNPQPENNVTSVSTSTTLSWECSDPEDDPLTYDVYFGTSSNPALVNSGQSETTYDPDTLNYETTYYWQIKAHDDHSNSTTGDIWQFSTIENQPPNPPSNPNPLGTSVWINTNLIWECSDPENDPLTYDVYFGTESDPPLIAYGQDDTTYNPGTMNGETTYYWKIKAHDDHSNSTTGEIWQFTTGELGTVTDYDGNVYQTFVIGDQEWMIENLRVTHYRNGDPIPHRTDGDDWTSTYSGAYCYYDNDTSNADTYGALYNWYAGDDSRGLAPEGWHVPTDNEIKELEMYLGMSQSQADDIGYRGTNEGSKLAGGYDLWNDGDLRNDPEFGSSGFSLLPGGWRSCNEGGPFQHMGNYGYFWSSTVSYNAWFRILSSWATQVFREKYSKKNGCSVRCVRD